MASAVERHACIANAVFIAIVHAMEIDLLPQPLPQHSSTAADRPILAAARAGMVGVGMGDQRPRHGVPRINPSFGCLAVEPFGGVLDQRLSSSIRSIGLSACKRRDSLSSIAGSRVSRHCSNLSSVLSRIWGQALQLQPSSPGTA